MTSQLPAQPLVLHIDRSVPVPSAPHRDAVQRSFEAILRRLSLNHPVALQGPAPEVRETEQVEAPSVGRATWRRCPWPFEFDQSRFLRVEPQTIPRESLRKYIREFARIRLSFKDHDEIIRKTDECGLPTQARPHFALKPEVERVVQVDVRE